MRATATGLSRHVTRDHRFSVRAAQAAGVPDDLVMLAHDIGMHASGCNDGSARIGQVRVEPSDNIFTVAHYAQNGWSVADLTRVLRTYQAAGNTALVAGEVFADLDKAMKRELDAQGGGVWNAVRRWVDQQDWVGEYCAYVQAGRYNFADHMVRSRVPFRYGQHMLGRVTASPARWLDLIEIAICINEDRGDPVAESLDHLVLYMVDDRVRTAKLTHLYAWAMRHGAERAALFGLAGLSKDEGLACDAGEDELRVLAALRA